MSSWNFSGTINGHQYSPSNIPNALIVANESGKRIQVGPNEFEQFSGNVTHNGDGSLSINGISHMNGSFTGDLQIHGTLTPN